MHTCPHTTHDDTYTQTHIHTYAYTHTQTLADSHTHSKMCQTRLMAGEGILGFVQQMVEVWSSGMLPSF